MNLIKFYFALFAICIFFSLKIVGQNYVSTYHPFINNAENFIINAQYKQAINQYKRAFKKTKKIFAKDYYNSLLCSIKVNDRIFARETLIGLLKKGVSINFLKSRKSIPLFFKNRFNNLVRNHFIEYKCNPYCDSLKKLVLRDQLIRQTDSNQVKLRNQNVDFLNAKELLSLISKYGFPNENVTGYVNGVIQDDFYGVIVMHQINANQSFNFKETLFEAVIKGDLSPNSAMFLYSSQSINDDLGFYGIYNFLNRETNKFELVEDKDFIGNIKAINEERTRWGIDTVENYYQKGLLENSNSQFIFGFKFICTNCL